MATITLTSGNDTTDVLDGTINGTNWSTYNGSTFDAGAGVDTLVVDDFWTTSHFSITTSGDGIITMTNSSGKTFNFTNYETVQFQNVTINLGTAASETITGSTKSDSFLFGLAGDDTIDGGAGSDKMYGGAGNDTYKVDATGDLVTENANEGTDTVNAGVTYTLGANVENLVLTGTSATNGTGNAGDNKLTGNDGINTLTGGDGADTLDGGLGADTLAGGLGNDTYNVDATDIITENAGEGTDTVNSSATSTLAANIENLVLTGTGAINGTGNALANTITGNAAANVIDGGLGADIMKGGLGNDTYVVNQTGETVTELAAQGTDTVKAAVTYALGANLENLLLSGATAINGTGNALANTITGNAAANIITGGAGRDTMTGGLGKDVFDFNLATETTKVATTRDVIKDFVHLTDRIDLSTIDANSKLAANQAFTFLATKGAAFTGVAGQLHYLASGTNTIVEGDTNGDKIADFQIELTGAKTLTSVDFVL